MCALIPIFRTFSISPSIVSTFERLGLAHPGAGSLLRSALSLSSLVLRVDARNRTLGSLIILMPCECVARYATSVLAHVASCRSLTQELLSSWAPYDQPLHSLASPSRSRASHARVWRIRTMLVKASCASCVEVRSRDDACARGRLRPLNPVGGGTGSGRAN